MTNATTTPVIEATPRVEAAPVLDGLALSLPAALALAEGETKTVVSAVTTLGVAMLLAIEREVEEAPADMEALETEVGRETLAELAVCGSSDEMTGIVVEACEVVALPGRLANPIAAG